MSLERRSQNRVRSGSLSDEGRFQQLIRKLFVEHQPPDQEFKFFKSETSREELAAYCEKATEYIHDSGIPNVAIIDRSSRPLYIGIREYWHDKYPNERMPGIYFMNPRGFKTAETLNARDVDAIIEDIIFSDDDSDEADLNFNTSEEISAQFQRAYGKLFAQKELPVLLFDSCIHSGGTIAVIKNAMEAMGFTDVRVGVVSDSELERSCNIVPDVVLTRDEPVNGCYPFDRDRMIEKTFDHLYSTKTRDADVMKRSTELRNEIKKIVRESIDKEHAPTEHVE